MYRKPEEIPEEEIKKWMRQYYPEYANNIELGRILYWRWLKKNIRLAPRKRNYTPVKIRDINNDATFVEIEGVVADKTQSEYEGCAVCKRKNCDNPEHRGRRYYVVENIYIGDDTGMIWCSRLYPKEEEPEEKIEIGYKIRVRGKVKRYRGEYEIIVDELEILEEKDLNNSQTNTDTEDEEKQTPSRKDAGDEEPKITVKKLIDVLKGFKGMKYKYLEIMMEKYGLQYKDLEPYLEVYEEDGEKYVRVKEGVET